MNSYPPQTEPYVQPTRRRRVAWRALFLGVLIGGTLLSLFSHLAQQGISNRLAGFMTGRRARIDTSSPAVVEKIRQLSRLETVSYSIDKIVEGNRDYPYLPDFLAGDKLLLVAHGEVIAGVDLSQLKNSDVSVQGDAVGVQLPAPQILATRIDSGQTRVYSRVTGLLVTADPNLESQVRLAAEQQFSQAALADGVIDKARQNARSSVSALLYGLGFRRVQVN